MTTTLCGHGRDVLIWALELWDTPDVAHGMMVLPSVHEGPAYTPAKRAALVATHDPAKLAELMAAELRRRGVQVLGFRDTSSFQFVSIEPTEGDVFQLRLELVHCQHIGSLESRRLNMPQARAAHLRLMQLPEGTPAQDVLKALEVGT